LKFDIVMTAANKSIGGRRVLDNFSAELASSEITCVMGKSGAGKSVFSRALVGLLVLDSGDVSIFGRPCARATPLQWRQLRRTMPLVLQTPALLDFLSLEDNVRVVQPDASKAMRALQLTGLAAMASKMPEQLSQGSRKCAVLARALALEPKVLILDEPTTGLDTEATAQVIFALQHIHRQGTGLVIVSHDLPLVARLAQRVLEVESGKCVFSGDPKAALARYDVIHPRRQDP
jgi:phospholipid/cholesterol/gamma-HCH transport system ATP-binding protein